MPVVPHRFLLISVGEGCEPVNRLWYIDLDRIPRSAGILDFSGFKPLGSKALPLVKLVDTFAAQYSYVANEGTSFTFQTNLNAPLYR